MRQFYETCSKKWTVFRNEQTGMGYRMEVIERYLVCKEESYLYYSQFNVRVSMDIGVTGSSFKEGGSVS